MNASLTHHNLHAALIEDDNGPGVLLQQDDSCGETQSVVLHPYQLRHVCEQLGLLSADAGAAKRIETLERRLHVLHDRIDHLGHYLTHYSDHEHADLSFERDYAMATVSISAEFVFDLADRQDEPPEPSWLDEPQTPSPTAKAAAKGTQGELAGMEKGRG